VACQRVRPRVEEDDGPVPPGRVPVLTVSVAQEPRELDATLRVLATSLLLAALVLAGGSALAVTLAVRRGLRPMERLGREADAVGAGSLGHRFPVSDLPAELRPIAARLNALLARLGEAFARERRFTADVAHELRTPVAELRALAEVALKWPEDDRPRENYRDVLQIARQMEALITRLLSIARCEAGAQAVGRERLDLCRMLRECWDSHAQAAGARQVRVEWALPDTLVVESDRAMLGALIDNLVSNAVTYAPAGGTVRVEAAHDGVAVALSVRNPCDGLGAADLPHLFEPFWRKDPARTGGAHCGLGLAVVAAYAKALGLALRADLPEPGAFEIVVSFPAPRRGDGGEGSEARRPASSITSSG
jgi:two-component system sensor histidine kinase QseC